MITMTTQRVFDDQGSGIGYEVRDSELVHVATRHGGATPTRWPVVPIGRSDEPGCVVWSKRVYFTHTCPAGGPAFVAAAREQERVARGRAWLAGGST